MIFGGQFSTIGDTLARASVSTISDPMVLNFAGSNQKNFVGSADILAAKTWELANAGNAQEFKFNFVLDAAYAQTMPNNFVMSDALWDDATKTWTPFDAGEYQASAVYNGTHWVLSIVGVYI